MSSRRIQDTPSTSFGLITWLNHTRLFLPLKAIECQFEVCGPAAHVEVNQVFHQDNLYPLDCTYTFPLPGNAAAYRCEVEINDRRIVAKVEELSKARQIFEEKKAEGHRVAMAEMERENLFTLQLGNVQPDDLVVVRFAYFQLLDRLGDMLSLQIPFCPGVRYIPGNPLIRSNRGKGVSDDTDQVPDASRISPPRIDGDHPDAAVLHVHGKLTTAGEGFATISSPSHPIKVVCADATAVDISLAHKGEVPDCDFVLRWREKRPTEQPRSKAWQVTGKDGERYMLAELVAPADVEVAVDSKGQDLYFLVDRSGSMQGAKWTKTCEAFLSALRLLRPADRAWATFFDDKCRDLAEGPLSPEALLSDRSVLSVEKMGTGGGTVMLPALKHLFDAMKKQTREDREAIVIIITDGQVGNEDEILRMLADVRGTVHTFGIDTAVNDAFLRDLAETHGGACVLMTPNDDIVAAVAALGERLRKAGADQAGSGYGLGFGRCAGRAKPVRVFHGDDPGAWTGGRDQWHAYSPR